MEVSCCELCFWENVLFLRNKDLGLITKSLNIHVHSHYFVFFFTLRLNSANCINYTAKKTHYVIQNYISINRSIPPTVKIWECYVKPQPKYCVLIMFMPFWASIVTNYILQLLRPAPKEFLKLIMWNALPCSLI